ncbi:unnamed protein product [Sphagnum compactum]
MAFGLGRGLSTPLMVINFILYLIAAALAGWALNRNINASVGTGNVATPWFLPVALIASVVGLASVLTGTHHLRVWRNDSLAAASAASLIAWMLTLLAMGLACKEIHEGGGYRLKRLKTLEALMIILSFFELLYLLSLHAGIATENMGAGNNRSGLKGGNNYGTPAAAAV